VTASVDPAQTLCYFQAVSKKTDKELKAPDQFVSFWSQVGSAVAARKQAVLGGVVALLATAVIIYAANVFLTNRAAKESQAFARIHAVATASLLPESGEAPKPEDTLPHFKTEKERLEAALKEADGFITGHGSRLRDEAQLLKARYLVALGRAGEALPIYGALTGSLDQRLRFLAQEGLAYAQESAGQPDKAIESFGQLAEQAKATGNFMRDRALYNKARLLEQKGAAKEAEKVYRDILTELPQSALKDEINDRLAVIEGK
jgi:tetratricopeptide (TPR) repeat protein